MKGRVLWGNSGSTYNGNPAFWNVIEKGALEWDKAKGKKPSEAFQDMLVDHSDDEKKQYKVECVSGVQIALYQAIIELITPGAFDRLMSGENFAISNGFSLVPGAGYAPDAIKPYLEETGDATKPADAAFLAALRPGTLVYFNNPGASPPWHGENAVFLGVRDGQREFFAHPFGHVYEADLLAKLNTKGGSHGKAYMHQGITTIKPSLASLK
jgi:hypothetical protein